MASCGAHELRNEIKRSKQVRREPRKTSQASQRKKEAKKVKRREGSGEKKRSKLRRNGIRACTIPGLSTRQKEAPNCPSQLNTGGYERLQKEQTDTVLCSSHESKAKALSKCGGKAMKSDRKWWSTRGTSVTRETLMPTQAPMRTLGSGLSLWQFAIFVLRPLNRLSRKQDRL